MPKLKPCPFCGGFAIMEDDANNILTYYGYPAKYVQCITCGMQTTHGDAEEVIAKWNRRETNE